MSVATLEIIDTLFFALGLIFGAIDVVANVTRRGKREPDQQGVRVSLFTVIFGGLFLLTAIGIIVFRLLGGS
jgi:hypothetical protein